MPKLKKARLESGIEIVDIGAKGTVIGKKEGRTYLTKDAVPGDVIYDRSQKKEKGFFRRAIDGGYNPFAHARRAALRAFRTLRRMQLAKPSVCGTNPA